MLCGTDVGFHEFSRPRIFLDHPTPLVRCDDKPLGARHRSKHHHWATSPQGRLAATDEYVGAICEIPVDVRCFQPKTVSVDVLLLRSSVSETDNSHGDARVPLGVVLP